MATIDWKTVDWNLSTKILAKRLRTTPTSVSNARRRHAPHTLRGFRSSSKRGDWDKADWSKSDQAIADAVGVSRSRVTAIRRQYHIPRK